MWNSCSPRTNDDDGGGGVAAGRPFFHGQRRTIGDPGFLVQPLTIKQKHDQDLDLVLDSLCLVYIGVGLHSTQFESICVSRQTRRWKLVRSDPIRSGCVVFFLVLEINYCMSRQRNCISFLHKSYPCMHKFYMYKQYGFVFMSSNVLLKNIIDFYSLLLKKLIIPV